MSHGLNEVFSDVNLDIFDTDLSVQTRVRSQKTWTLYRDKTSKCFQHIGFLNLLNYQNEMAGYN